MAIFRKITITNTANQIEEVSVFFSHGQYMRTNTKWFSVNNENISNINKVINQGYREYRDFAKNYEYIL